MSADILAVGLLASDDARTVRLGITDERHCDIARDSNSLAFATVFSSGLFIPRTRFFLGWLLKMEFEIDKITNRL